MEARASLRSVRFAALVVGGGVLALGLVGGVGLVAAIPAVLAAWAVARYGHRAVVARANARLVEAVAAGRTEDALALFAALRELSSHLPATQHKLAVNEAALLALSDRHAEVVRLLAPIERAPIAAPWGAWRDNHLAWSLAHVGEGTRALAIAQATPAAAAPDPSHPRELLACQLATLGACLVATGDHAAAEDPLARALALGGTPPQQAARAFFLGEALRGLGRAKDAQHAYERSTQEDAACPHGVRAAAAAASSAPEISRSAGA